MYCIVDQLCAVLYQQAADSHVLLYSLWGMHIYIGRCTSLATAMDNMYRILTESSGMKAISLLALLCHCRPTRAPLLLLHRCLPTPSSWQAQRATWASEAGYKPPATKFEVSANLGTMYARALDLSAHSRACILKGSWKPCVVDWVGVMLHTHKNYPVYWKVTKKS